MMKTFQRGQQLGAVTKNDSVLRQMYVVCPWRVDFRLEALHSQKRACESRKELYCISFTLQMEGPGAGGEVTQALPQS